MFLVEAAIAAEVKPTSSSEILAITVKPTALTTPPPPPETKKEEPKSSFRQGKSLSEESPVQIEASEVDPPLLQLQSETKKATQIILPSTPELQISSQVHVVASPANVESGEFIEQELSSPGQTGNNSGEENEEKNESGENFQSNEDGNNNNVSPPPPSTNGFTLKLHKTPVLVTPAFSTPVVVTAQKVQLPPPPPPAPVVASKGSEEPTGILNKIHETRVKDGKTTVIETRIIGTYIGTQYARILESTSSILAIQPTKAPSPSANFVVATAASAPPSTTPKAPPTTPDPKPVQLQVESDQPEAELEQEDDPSFSKSLFASAIDPKFKCTLP
jgi:hypothetical protein